MEDSPICPRCSVAPPCGKHCGARKRQPPHGPCLKSAGAGTDHPGLGSCRLHTGSTAAGRKHARQLQQELFDAILDAAPGALARVAVLVDSGETDAIRLAAARDLLDRSGLGAKFHHEHTGPDGGPIPVEVRTAALLERARGLRPAPPAKSTTTALAGGPPMVTRNVVQDRAPGADSTSTRGTSPRRSRGSAQSAKQVEPEAE